jgi:hypothetical protein
MRASGKLGGGAMEHDRRLLKNEERIEELRANVPEWIKRLERPVTPALIPKFGPLNGGQCRPRRSSKRRPQFRRAAGARGSDLNGPPTELQPDHSNDVTHLIQQ